MKDTGDEGIAELLANIIGYGCMALAILILTAMLADLISRFLT